MYLFVYYFLIVDKGIGREMKMAYFGAGCGCTPEASETDDGRGKTGDDEQDT